MEGMDTEKNRRKAEPPHSLPSPTCAHSHTKGPERERAEEKGKGGVKRQRDRRGAEHEPATAALSCLMEGGCAPP